MCSKVKRYEHSIKVFFVVDIQKQRCFLQVSSLQKRYLQLIK
jgi:hypothetical protein